MDLIDPGHTPYLFLFGALLAFSAVLFGIAALYTNGMVLKRVPAAAFLEDVTARLAAKREELKAVELAEEERRREARESLVELERVRAARQAEEERLSVIRVDIEASKDEARRAEEVSADLAAKLEKLAVVEQELLAKEERLEELARREDRVADAEIRIDEVEARIAELTNAKTKAQEEFDRTTGDLAAKREELKAAELGVAEATAKAEEAQKSLEAARSEATAMEDRVAELQRQAQVLGEEAKAIEERTREAEARIVELADARTKAQEELDRTTGDLAAKREELKAAELGVAEATAKAEDVQKGLEAARSEATAMEDRVAELQCQAQVLVEEAKAIEERTREAEARAEAAGKAAAAAEEAAATQRTLLAEAEKASAEAVSALEGKRKEVLEAERSVAVLQVRASALEAEILRLRGEHAGGSAADADGKAPPLDLERVPECLGAQEEDGRIKPAMAKRLARTDERDALESVRKHLSALKLSFPERTLKAFHTCLKVSPISPITVLAGISGTGKSQLPRRYAEAMGLHFLKVAVQPRWDGPQDILGFYNYLEKSYKATDLARAMTHLDPVNWPDRARPFQGHMMLVLLDEMNLARVEYYFSEFLSGLEGRPLPGTETEDRVRKLSLQLDLGRIGKGVRSLYAGHNILFVGSMNEDESTLSLSDKVLDRSNLLRFPRPETLANEPPSDHDAAFDAHLPEEQWRSWCRRFDALPDPVKTNAKDWVRRLNEAMDSMGRPFGHRLNQAILSYVANYPGSDDQGVARIAFADQIEQRILPKLRGVELADSAAPLEKLHGLIANDLKDDELAKALRDAMADDGTGRTFNWRGVRRTT
ncbi:AAA family ATPase [Azospirillum sp. TSO5]|uniref:AAA family ATPase n=1 Tax=Azospirillum sp. TSO5 TaxID=716760 RepID=UPI000D65C00B|nr:AAA family ATPase [Azospirillum sp. TSO5]